MNANLHMAGDLKNTGQGNLFVVFGKPDVELLSVADGDGVSERQVKINGVDIYRPGGRQVRSYGAAGIACRFVDTDYNKASFFVRQACFGRQQFTLPGAESHAEGGGGRRGLGIVVERYFAPPLPRPGVGAYRRQGNQPLGG